MVMVVVVVVVMVVVVVGECSRSFADSYFSWCLILCLKNPGGV